MVDDEKLMAYADGELGAVERAAIEAAIAADPGLGDRVAAHRALRGALSGAFDPILDETLPPRLAVLKGSTGFVNLATERERRRSSLVTHWGSMAATLLVGILGGYLLAGPPGMVGGADGALVARGELANALDTQLAAEDPATLGSPVRIGLTFRDQTGVWCRSFKAVREAGISGIACRDADQWHLRLAMSAEHQPGTDYRMAGSDEQLMQTVQSMMDGQPLDVVGERDARDRGWPPKSKRTN